MSEAMVAEAAGRAAMPARGTTAPVTRRRADAQRAGGADWFLWLPVLIAAGAALYLSLPREPATLAVAALAMAGIAAARLAALGKALPAAFVAAAVIAGFAAAKARTEWVAAPVLAATTGPTMLTGIIEDITPTGPNSARLKLAVKGIEGIAPAAWPARAEVRIGTSRGPALARGMTVRFKATLGPLARPLQPGGYDHARTQWYRGVGARGRALGPVEIVPGVAATPTLAERLDDVRAAIGARIRAALPGAPGAMAEALIVGERGFLPAEVNQALQVSGLAHILSISGLHMSLVGGGVFFAVRAFLALFPGLVLRYPIKAWSAGAGLAAATIYLAISGGGAATWRSYVMIAVMFVAVMAGRPALAMHNLAVAAVVVLVAAPESVADAGFQMSFLAVMGLIAFNDARMRWLATRPTVPALRRFAHPVAETAFTLARAGVLALAGIVATSLVASIFSGLPAAYHFNRVSVAGVLANLLALPVVSAVVMPAAVMTLIALPFGLEAWPLWVMGQGLGVVIAVADHIAALPGAGAAVASPPPLAMALAAFGLVAVCIARGRGRWAGAALIAAAGVVTVLAPPRSDIVIEAEGRTVAVRGDDGRLVPVTARRGRFAAEHWLLSEGDATPLKEAAKRPGWTCTEGRCRASVKGRSVLFLAKGASPDDMCRTASIVIAAEPLFGRCKGAGLVIDRFDLWRAGAHAVSISDDGTAVVTTAAAARGDRPWAVTPVPRASIRVGTASPHPSLGSPPSGNRSGVAGN